MSDRTDTKEEKEGGFTFFFMKSFEIQKCLEDS